jgi:alkanesulfonate monooxygenase SsuD/methylene tetrahydromethanopterin reductase-like flavin-dependent oxidoreductase (luciferase family)
MRHPLPLAKELATLQNFSGGRLILGAGVGWLESEFAALGVPFHERGRRMDEGIAMMRAVWTQDPVTFRSKYIPAEITEMTMSPRPVRPIPICSARARRRRSGAPCVSATAGTAAS